MPPAYQVRVHKCASFLRASRKCACAASLRACFYQKYIFHMCYLRMRQDNAFLHAAMMARADTVIVCQLPLAKNAMHQSNIIVLKYQGSGKLIKGGAARVTVLWSVSLFVYLSVSLSVTTFSVTTRNETTKERHQKAQRYIYRPDFKFGDFRKRNMPIC